MQIVLVIIPTELGDVRRIACCPGTHPAPRMLVQPLS
jgi:hypothetical protein